jgi:GH43 family beta-xylosidase
MQMPALPPKTYKNPVYPESFPDPFVLKHDGDYFAFCTGHAHDGRAFGVVTSRDLVNWKPLAGAMEPLPPEAGPLYWAPEVTYYDGRFYLYYSVGNETFMQIRVAISDTPEGPYVDSGNTLTKQDFAIDPHVFVDDEGSRYMFYATDFLDYSHIGTGTVVDKMLDPFTLAGEPRPVTRAKYDWQVYDPARKEKGGVRWHTVEGPFVLKHKDTYFEMFSGGNWQNITYGVGYAVSATIENNSEWTQHIDGTDTLPLLRTIPDRIIGPGHNSVVQGPNGGEMFCVYHRWQDDKRVMCIDRMGFAGGDGLFVAGPTDEPQRMPFDRDARVELEELFYDTDLTGRGWSVTGADLKELDRCVCVTAATGDSAILVKEVRAGDHELVVNLRVDEALSPGSAVTFGCGTRPALFRGDAGWQLSIEDEVFAVPNYSPAKFRQFRTLSEGGMLELFLDEWKIGSAPAPAGGEHLVIAIRDAIVTLDMVRYTNL